MDELMSQVAKRVEFDELLAPTMASSLLEPREMRHYEQRFRRRHAGFLLRENATAQTRNGEDGEQELPKWQKFWYELEDGVLKQREAEEEGDEWKSGDVLETGLPIQFVSRITSSQKQGLHVLCLTYIQPGKKTARSVLLGTTSQDDVNDWLLAFHSSLAGLLEESMTAPSPRLLSASIDDALDTQGIDLGLGFGHGNDQRAARQTRCGREETRPGHMSGSPRDATPPVPVPRKKVEPLPTASAYSAFSLGDEGLGTALNIRFAPDDPSQEISGQDAEAPVSVDQKPSERMESMERARGEDWAPERRVEDDRISKMAPMPKPSEEPVQSTAKYIPPAMRRRMQAEAEAERMGSKPESGETISTEEEGMFDMELAMQGMGLDDDGEEDTQRHPWTHGFGWQWLSGSSSLIGPRKENQDTFLETERFCVESEPWQRLPGSAADTDVYVGLWAVFDGHRGRQCADFLRDQLPDHLRDSFRKEGLLPAETEPEDVGLRAGEPAERAVSTALWSVEQAYSCAPDVNDSGSTAIVAMMVRGQLVIGLVGDSAAILSRGQVAHKLTEEHTPGRADERARIEACGGWVTSETELFLGQVRRMDLRDPRIRDKASQKCRVVTIHRVCGILAVSRAIGDQDFKNFTLETPVPDPECWEFPDGHCQRFEGSLVSSEAEVKLHALEPDDHFVLLACDGFWDVVSPEECVYFVWARLREEGIMPDSVTKVTKKLADRIAGELADLALRSGSSDNVTVVIIFLDPLRN